MIFAGIAIVVALVISFLVMPLVKKIAVKLGVLDYPDKRKVHTMPIPRLGGLGIVVSFYIGIIIAFGFSQITLQLLVPPLFIILAGLLDDFFTIKPVTKLILQFAGAVTFILLNPNSLITFFNVNGQVVALHQLSVVITIIWLIGASNAINLIDGLDGLAGGVSLIASLVLGLICLLMANYIYGIMAFVLAASIAGFLKYNFYPASIFMGDTGALFLGFILGEISVLGTLKGAAIISILLPILVLGVPIFDTLWSIIRRLISRKPIMIADKNHLHHRLLRAGFTHRQTVLFIYGISAVLGVVAILVRYYNLWQTFIIVGIVLFILFLLFWRMGLFKKDDDQVKEQGGDEE